MKVLLLEADELGRDMLARRLARSGHTVVTATDSEATVRLADTERPEVILADFMLLRSGGWALPRQLADALTPRSVPLIALCARDMPGDREQALAAGCAAYERKPIELERLLGTLTALRPGGEES
jgi:DNA-binding response OmpR family regulator